MQNEAFLMRNELLGYALGALEPPEMISVEKALADPIQGPSLRRDLDSLRRATQPLSCDKEEEIAPAGLARRTLMHIAAQGATNIRSLPMPRVFTPEATVGHTVGSRIWLDRMIIAATAVAASVLVGPLLLDSITQSRERRAEKNLSKASAALQAYAESHRIFPTPPNSGPLSRAGLYAPTLVSEQRLVADDGTLLCSDSVLSGNGNFCVPTLEELKAAIGTPRFEEMVRSMGGDYGYSLGHRDASGTLQPYRNFRRAHHPIMADAPDESGEKSGNHPEGIHFILFEDGHIQRFSAADIHRDDHLYRNHDGHAKAGLDAEDAVIGDSHHQP